MLSATGNSGSVKRIYYSTLFIFGKQTGRNTHVPGPKAANHNHVYGIILLYFTNSRGNKRAFEPRLVSVICWTIKYRLYIRGFMVGLRRRICKFWRNLNIKNKILWILFSVCACLLFGCSKAPDTPNTLPPALMIDDVLYYYTGKEVSVNIDEESIIGTIASTVPLSELPSENGQSNMNISGCSYAPFEENFVVRMEEKWMLFERRDAN